MNCFASNTIKINLLIFNAMKDLEISKDLRDNLEKNQLELKTAIENHQLIFRKLQNEPDNQEFQKDLSKAEEEVILIGLEQKSILESLRTEFQSFTKTVQADVCKNGLEERRQNLTNSLVRARKQNIVLKPLLQASFSEESNDESSIPSSPERNLPLEPHDVSQTKFLSYFALATHETYREMQNRRVERKRRSTANPHFLYGNKGWDFLPQKRKRNNYLASTFSPPNTRQSVKKRNERVSPPGSIIENGSPEPKIVVPVPIPSIPNLPSELTIERVSPSSSPDLSVCCVCKQSSGTLLLCELCQNGFHVNCHNRPLPQTPKRCPGCFTKELPTSDVLTTTQVSPAKISEKIEEKQKLQGENDSLCAELTQLQDRHSQLTISLKNQKCKREELLSESQSTEEKIEHILSFIQAIKKSPLKDTKSND